MPPATIMGHTAIKVHNQDSKNVCLISLRIQLRPWSFCEPLMAPGSLIFQDDRRILQIISTLGTANTKASSAPER